MNGEKRKILDNIRKQKNKKRRKMGKDIGRLIIFFVISFHPTDAITKKEKGTKNFSTPFIRPTWNIFGTLKRNGCAGIHASPSLYIISLFLRLNQRGCAHKTLSWLSSKKERLRRRWRRVTCGCGKSPTRNF